METAFEDIVFWLARLWLPGSLDYDCQGQSLAVLINDPAVFKVYMKKEEEKLRNAHKKRAKKEAYYKKRAKKEAYYKKRAKKEAYYATALLLLLPLTNKQRCIASFVKRRFSERVVQKVFLDCLIFGMQGIYVLWWSKV